MTNGQNRGRVQLAVAAALLVVSLVVLVPSLDDPGTEMDEGTLVAYPQLVLGGELPGADFETFYGPGEPYLVAGLFEVAGPSVATERAVGLVFRLLVVFAVFVLVLPWGWVPALIAALASLLVAAPLAVTALALFAAIGLGLAALATLSMAVQRDRRGEPAGGLVVAGGVLAGAALAFRYDLVLAVALGALPLWLALSPRLRLRSFVAFAVACLPLIAWALAVGVDGITRLLEDVAASRGGRSLPLPGPTELSGEALAAVVLACVTALGWTVYARRTQPRRDGAGDPRFAILLSLVLFTAALIPATIQRADDAHVLPLAAVAVALLPPVGIEAFAFWRKPAGAVAKMLVALTLAAVVVGAVAVLRGGVTGLRNQYIDLRTAAVDVRLGDRDFPIADAQAAGDLNTLLPQLAAMSAPGDTLFVGTRDLRLTPYGDTFVYFLTPNLEPASFYTELNPGTANAEDSGLAEELARADFLLLTTRWAHWDEPNESVDPGSGEANAVVDRHFRTVARAGSYELLARAGATRPGP